jgi:hypothetical protein
MASVKVLKPTQPVNLLNTPVAPKPYTLSYYEWLETQGREANVYYTDSAVGGDLSVNLFALLKTESMFIKSITLGANFNENITTPVVVSGNVKIKTNIGKKVYAQVFLNNEFNAQVPLVIVKNFNPPIRINGSDFIDLVIDEDLWGFCDIQGFIVPNSILFF